MMSGDRKQLRRFCTAIWAGALALLWSSGPLRADPINGEITVTTDVGYARLLIKLDEEVEAKVTINGKPGKVSDLKLTEHAKGELCLDDVWLVIDEH